MSNLFVRLQRQWRVLLLSGLLLAVFSLGVSFLAPLQFRADADILILTRQQAGSDPLSIARAQEQLAETIARSVETDAFYQQVRQADTSNLVADEYDGLSEKKRRERWQENVEARAVFGTNVVTVSAYSKNRESAEALASLLADGVVQTGSEYAGTLIVARVVNEPIASTWPLRPNFLLNTIVGFLVGFFGMMWVVAARYRSRIL